MHRWTQTCAPQTLQEAWEETEAEPAPWLSIQPSYSLSYLDFKLWVKDCHGMGVQRYVFRKKAMKVKFNKMQQN